MRHLIGSLLYDDILLAPPTRNDASSPLLKSRMPLCLSMANESHVVAALEQA